ncbi:hypothetical protein DAH55_10725 [Sphingomonas koreensis]|uniref:hypothetical protein n=1 Tax=Sphingomonas koreensis TaxID=93064 RepID=UPI00082C537E|nr:hypothetical protein [Sphingomonas koreensis]PJI87217.1 hypothetical protein BDW16_0448 [Sphingomonas koreensis]RSU59570.1 hypothetical protein DAH56_11350 [Sphingomonas koreensis]RSU68723.1 hypothetical protein DAH55_10725 [Sphingomonas koreensis]
MMKTDLDDLDDLMRRLASVPVDPRLAARESEWLAMIHAAGSRGDHGSFTANLAIVAGALAIGVMADGMPGASDQRAALFPLVGAEFAPLVGTIAA